MPSNEDHGYTSPSQLWRCKMCPGSVNLLRKIDRGETSGGGVDSPAAARGTYLHSMTEAISRGLAPVKLWVDNAPFDLTEADLGDVRWCLDQIEEVKRACGDDALVIWEHKMDLNGLGISTSKHGNRADILIVVPGEYVVVIDLKFGVGWVPGPRTNSQFQAYAWGAVEEFGGHDAWCIKLQPALPESMRYSDYTFDRGEVEDIGEEIRGIVDACDVEDAPLCRGEHCMFCKVKDETCPQHRDTFLSLPQHVSIYEFMNRISTQERGLIYSGILAGLGWADKAKKAIYKWGIENCNEGDPGIDGFCIADGRSSNDWADPIKAKAVIRKLAKDLGKNGKDCLSPPQPSMPLSPYAVQQVLGSSKEVRDALVPLIVSTIGNPVLKKAKIKK